MGHGGAGDSRGTADLFLQVPVYMCKISSDKNPSLTSTSSVPRYSADHEWAKLPKQIRPGYTHGVVEDSKGRIYISNMSQHDILIFNAEGEYISSWGEAYASGAHGLMLHREESGEFLYLSNSNLEEVVKTTLEGDVIWRIGTPPVPWIYSEEKRFMPTETAVAPDGSVYVTDGYGQHYVHQFDPNGGYLKSFGGSGSEPGKLQEPHGICVDTRCLPATLLVANRANRRIDRFSLDGFLIETIIGLEQLRYPCTAVISGDQLYVPDLFGRLSIFDRENRLVTHLGDYLDGRDWNKSWGSFHELDSGLQDYPNIAPKHRHSGKFSSPHGLCVDHAGNLFVVEWISDGRITKLILIGD